MEFDQELDVRGQVCPYPSLRTKKALKKMTPGSVLKVLIDFKPAVESVKRELEKTSHEWLHTEEEEDEEWAVFFKCVK